MPWPWSRPTPRPAPSCTASSGCSISPTIDRDPLLFGWDAAPGLLACQLGDDGRSIELYRRGVGPGAVERETVPFVPFLLAADPTTLRGATGLVALEHLAGDGALAWLARFESFPAAVAARERLRAGGPDAAAPASYRFFSNPAQQYLLTSGRASFGNLRFTDLRRLALDIEVITTEGYAFPSATRPGDRIVAVALADSTGYRHVVRGDRLDERALLEECSRLVRERDPDVIEGHNIFRFDLEYLVARARGHGVPLRWGRDGSPLRGRPARLTLGGRSIGYRRFEVTGRHVVDTWILAQVHDVGTRDLPSFGLKDIARHFGVAVPGRTYVEAARISQEFVRNPERLMAYAADDAVETLAISAILSPSSFAQAQFLPLDYQSTTLHGAAAKIDALMLRAYLRGGHAVPVPAIGVPVGGGYTAVFHQGVAQPVHHVDVTSLYPSLMLTERIAPRSDGAGVFLVLLDRLREFRLAAKRGALAAADPETAAHLGALQQSFKILINAFYGYLAFSAGHWNDFEAANRVTASGRQTLQTILDRLTDLGAIPLEADTDGVYFVPPAGKEDPHLFTGVAGALPPGIQLELDGRYAAMFSYKPKTYGLLDQHGRLILKGAAFRSRALEPFLRDLIETMVRLLLTGRETEAKRVVDGWLEDFAAHRVPVQSFARMETLPDSLDVYHAALAAGARPPSAACEAALQSGRAWQAGDQISYYVSGRGARIAVHEHARLADTWSAARPDENVEYYQTRVLETWERFRPFAEHPALRPFVGEPESPAQLSLF